MAEPRSPRLAVLIDADNASAKIVDGLFEEIAKIGEASVRRIYGDFANPRSKAWIDVLARHAIIPQQQFAYTAGKNASDITLVIDAMDLLHSGRFDGFAWYLPTAISPASPLASVNKASTSSVLESRRRLKVSGRPAGVSSIPKICCPWLPRTDRYGTGDSLSPASDSRHAHHQEGHRPDGKRGWMGAAWRRRQSTCKSRFGF